MSSLSTGEYRSALELVAEALSETGPEFPGTLTTGLLARIFDAEFAGAGDVDLRGVESRRWADSPGLIEMARHSFHEWAISHPLTEALRRPGGSIPLRLSDVASAKEVRDQYDESGMPHALEIPLAVTTRHICAVVAMRSDQDFTTQDLVLGRQLQPVLRGVYALRQRIDQNHQQSFDGDTGIPVSARELLVLNLMSDGLIAAP